MSSVHQEVVVQSDAAHAWDVIRDVGAVHTRLLPGRVANTRIEGDYRFLTFPDGREIRELIIDIDDDRRRFSYAVIEGDSLGLTYHHATFQVEPDGEDQCRLLWVTELLPATLVDAVRVRMEIGGAEMGRVIEGSGPGGRRASMRRSER
ncbi:polyketide cyclase [bacterium SCGC AG-212-C10]|nr:polyketide cyclase [bacterium SCGC AG-212-C10]